MAQKYSAPAVVKLLDIVELLSKENRGFSINEISRLLNIPINTVYRICKEMEERRYLDKNADTGLYGLGTRFFHIGQAVGSRIDLRTKALPIMTKLRDDLGETVHLCILQQEWMVLLEQVETEHPIRIHVEPGSLMYPHASAFGKCLLAEDSEAFSSYLAKDIIVSLTERTITSKEALKEELKGVKDKGWATDMEEYMEGVRCIGAPLYGRKRNCIAAMGVMGPAYRLSEDKMGHALPVVRQAVHQLSLDMGFTD